MTTSSDNLSPSPPSPDAGHWQALSDSLPEAPVALLDEWFDQRLSELESRHEHFVTPHSLRKNLRG